MALLKNVTVEWASIIKPNTTYTPEWSVNVLLSKEQAKQLVEESKTFHPKGIKIKTDEKGRLFFKFRRRVMKADGVTENNPPKVYDASMQPFTKLVGNGSVCNVQYGFSAYDNKFGKGVTSDLKGVQVLYHVPYGVQDGDEFEVVEGESQSTPPLGTRTEDSNEFDDEDFN